MGRLRDFFLRSGRTRQKHNKGEGGEETPPTPAQPDPAETTASPRRHGRLRRSLSMKKLRSSFRRKETYVPPASKPHQWQVDEKLVRAGTCSFAVKYLGSVQVNESRGMHICEEAAKHLRSTQRKKVRAILWVGSDGLRVVEDESKGLLVDQTIEKVSFCAPDRNQEKGFSYISRDGTTRRWLCHCFLSLKEPGERLSHAVGCAFAACLERKQQRDKLCGVQVEFDVNKTSFTRQGSFRQTTMTEQIEAEQKAKETQPESSETQAEMSPVQVQQPFARPRRHASNDLLMRARSSFRGAGQLSEQSPFKRSTSLRLNELPSTLLRQQQVLQTHQELSPIHSPTSPTVPEDFSQQAAVPTRPAAIPQPPNQAIQQPGMQNGVSNISDACQQLTNGLFELGNHHQQQQQQQQQQPTMGFAAGIATPTNPQQQVIQQQGMAVNGAIRPVHLSQQPISQSVHVNQQVIGQPSVPNQSVPPQLPPRTLQPTVEPIKQTNPWETSPSPPQQPSNNPWGTATASSTTTTPTQARLTEAEKWLVQTSQTISPLGSPQQQVAQVQVHSGGDAPIQNGHSQVQTYQQQPSQQAMVASMNYNNANNAATVNIATQDPATQYNKGISGTWTNDMSRTLPNANLQNGNSNSSKSTKLDNFEAKWDALDHQSKTSSQAPNPFKNATKTFEINL